MTIEELAKQAAEESCSEKTTAHHGGAAGRPFWNAEAFEFLYVPAFQFQWLPGSDKYIYEAEDCNGELHVFEDREPTALLTPIWGELPVGVVQLKVYATKEIGKKKESVSADNALAVEEEKKEYEKSYLIGARTFCKLSPFPADLPKRACSYEECVNRAVDFALNEGFMRHWLEKGTPDPDYDLNVYPTKMITAIIDALLEYSELCTDKKKAEEAMKIATNSADYLISITPGKGSPVEGLPPTYQLDFRPDYEKRKNLSAKDRIDTTMLIYPAYAGTSFLLLEKKTQDKKYLDAALKIGEYYKKNVQPNGSWHIVISVLTGESLSSNYCEPLERIVPFLMSLYERTGDESWKTLADGAIKYVEDNKLKTYEWEAQFEDSLLSVNYSNLTHYGACALVRHYAKYYADDPEKMAVAEDLMRFVEDQFVIWKNPSPWNRAKMNTADFLTPCGLEQYVWHMPIDASTSDIISTFLAMYKAGRGELYLAKAKALADQLTRVQLENGMIPTHWMDPKSIKGENFWINCMFMATKTLSQLSTYLKENNLID